MTDGSEGGAEARRFFREKGIAADVAALAEPVLESLDFRLVRVVVSARSGATVQIMVERPKGAITIEDCSLISRQLSPVLDAGELAIGRHNLEISSPGIDRPLVRPSDFEDWSGYEARIELREMVGGRKRFRGLIEGYEQGELRLEVALESGTETQILGFPVDLIESAKLVMTDELVAAALARRKNVGQSENDNM